MVPLSKGKSMGIYLQVFFNTVTNAVQVAGDFDCS